MSDVRQALTGILAALVSALIILGSIVLALTETGQKIARLPETSASLSTPMPPMDTPKPGEPTFTAVPTRVPQTPSVGDTYSCVRRPGWQTLPVLAGDTWEALAQTYGISLDELLRGNCLEREEFKNNKLGSGMVIYIPQRQPTDIFTPTVTATPTPTSSPTPTKAKSGQGKPKATHCAGPPSYWVRYTVRSGDTLYKISQLTGTTWVLLRDANCLKSTTIYPGQVLRVPRPVPVSTPVRSATPRPTRTATVTRTLVPTAAPPDTAVPTDTPRPTDPPPPSATPLPSDTPLPTAYP